MLGFKISTYNENGLGEPEQDANSALTELDKGLRSGRVGEQCEAIVRFPRLFEKYPFPILINSSLLKLADVFRVGCLTVDTGSLPLSADEIFSIIENTLSTGADVPGKDIANSTISEMLILKTLDITPESTKTPGLAGLIPDVWSNFLRVWVLRVCQQSEKHLDKILNVDEFVRRIFSVIHSNDPVARALTLRTLGSVAGIIPERQQVHHSIRRSLDSHDAVEVEAAIYAAVQFAAQSKNFAVSMCNKFSDMIQGVATPADMKLKLIPVLQHMHHDTSTAAMVRQMCTDLLPSYPAQNFVLVTLKTLTQLASATVVDIPDQVSLLIKYLQNDPRWEVKAQILKSLRQLADQGAHLWSPASVEAVVDMALDTPYQQMLSWCLDVLCVLAKSAAACHSQLNSDSPLMTLCRRSCYSSIPIVSAKAVKVLTRIVCFCSQDELPMEVVTEAADTVESLFVLVTYDPNHNNQYELKVCLSCAVDLCKAHRELCPRFVDLIGIRLMGTSGTYSVLLCEALGAIGGMQPESLVALLPNILSKLQEMNQLTSHSGEESQTMVMLSTLVFQTMVGYEWRSDVETVITDVIKNTNLWASYRIARSASRYGHHSISAGILTKLSQHVSSEHFHFWLICLQELSRGEAELLNRSHSTLVSRLNLAVSHYSKAVAALKAASTPVYTLQFQAEYTRLRGEFLQCFAQLVHTCHGLCTSPPPAVAGAIVLATRDELQRYGHITHQLRKCVKEFRACADMYWKLYQSAFDADPCSLANIQILQQMCLLVAHSIERIALSTSQTCSQDEIALDFSSQDTSLETYNMLRCCQQASAVAQELMQIPDLKPITHQHIDCLLKQVEILVETPISLPRYFFQVLQSTSVKLAISPQPRVLGEPINVQSGSQLAVKVEGVIQHGKRPGLFRSVQGVTITVSSQTPPRVSHNSDGKVNDAGSIITQTVTPHRDFFAAQFLLAFPAGGQYLVVVDAALTDENGNMWRTGPRSTLTVKSHEEGGKAGSSSARSGFSGRF